MEGLLEWIEYIEDSRQQARVQHCLKDILVTVLLATLSNANEWEEMEDFSYENKDYLKKYLALKKGIPSHDTLQRVMGRISP